MRRPRRPWCVVNHLNDSFVHVGKEVEHPAVPSWKLLPTTAIVALVSTAPSQGAEPHQASRDTVSARLAVAELLSAADPNESLSMSVTLQLQHRNELDALVAAQQASGMPAYHRWLSPEAFGARFGVPADTYTALTEWLQGKGFAVQTWPSRSRVDFTGRVHDVEAAFGVRMNAYRHRGRRALANADPPLLPARFAANVQSLRLNTFRLAEPLVRVEGVPGATAAMGPHDIDTVYDIVPILARGIDGTGQTIAVVARSDFNASDVSSFQQQFGLPVRAPVKVFPASNPGVGSPNGACAGIRNPRALQDCIFGEESEVLLDTQWAGALAPGATVLVDISDTDIDASLTDIVNHHSNAKVVSISFGLCERLEPAVVQTMEPMYLQAAAQGQTVVVAAGDDGADECQDGLGASVNGLASSAEVTAVGGTALDPGFDASGTATRDVSEVVWDDNGGASGGGVSAIVPKPSYQIGVGIPQDGFRDQPDVSLMASPSQAGYVMVIENTVQLIGGTSVAAPGWAGIVALLNHATGRDGSGAINESLYALGIMQYNQSGPLVFHDITSGNNGIDHVLGFAATGGFDLATGWGSPDVALLVHALASQACPGDCNMDGEVTVDELLTAVSIALGTAPSSQCPRVDANGDGQVGIDDIVNVATRALNGC